MTGFDDHVSIRASDDDNGRFHIYKQAEVKRFMKIREKVLRYLQIHGLVFSVFVIKIDHEKFV